MNPYNYKWMVTVKKGLWMSGVHRFKTKKEAQKFVEDRLRAADLSKFTMADIPKIERQYQF